MSVHIIRFILCLSFPSYSATNHTVYCIHELHPLPYRIKLNSINISIYSLPTNSTSTYTVQISSITPSSALPCPLSLLHSNYTVPISSYTQYSALPPPLILITQYKYHYTLYCLTLYIILAAFSYPPLLPYLTLLLCE